MLTSAPSQGTTYSSFSECGRPYAVSVQQDFPKITPARLLSKKIFPGFVWHPFRVRPLVIIVDRGRRPPGGLCPRLYYMTPSASPVDCLQLSLQYCVAALPR